MTDTTVFRLAASSALLSFALAGSLVAQDQPAAQMVRGPVMGFVLDKASGVRPILGVPGAATLGQTVLDKAGLESVTPSAGRDYALAVLSSGRQTVLVRNLSAAPSAAILDVTPGATRIEVSPSGDAAALYYADTRRVEVLAGLPASPSVAWSIELADLQDGLAALAVSDGGGALLVARAGDQAPVWFVTPDAGQNVLCSVDGSPSLTFLTGSLDAAVVDGVAASVVVVRNPKAEPQLTRVGGQAQGISRPLAIAAARDNTRLFVANAEPAGVVSLSLAGEEPATLPCDCTPTGLERMASGSAFRLSDAGAGPIWLLDASSTPARIVFVPEQTQILRESVSSPLPGRRGGDR